MTELLREISDDKNIPDVYKLYIHNTLKSMFEMASPGDSYLKKRYMKDFSNIFKKALESSVIKGQKAAHRRTKSM